jgi:hypothetical protein
MCDYSLMGVPNRLANEGEDLVVHRFRTGSIGLISDTDLPQVKTTGPWPTLKGLFGGSASPQATAVCIAPGARLLLKDIPEEMQRWMKVNPSEEVVFTQVTAEVNTYRDAVRFGNGAEVLLQRLREGQRVKVLQLSLSNEPVGSGEGGFANTPLSTL